MFKPVKAFLQREIIWNFRTKLFCFCAVGGLSFPIWRLLILIGHEGSPGSCIQPDFLVLAPIVGAAGLPFVSLSLIKLEPVSYTHLTLPTICSV